MTTADLRLQVSFLKRALRTTPPELGAHELGASLLACVRTLVKGGDPLTALGLLEDGRLLHSSLCEHDRLALGLAETRALRIAGRSKESLQLVRRIEHDFSSLLASAPHERIDLKLAEAAALWRVNDVDHAILLLRQLHAELLGRPDSEHLATCCYELSSAYLFSGEHSLARSFALEAFVSARRTQSRLVEAHALENLYRLDRFLCRWRTAEDQVRQAMALFEDGGHVMHAAVARSSLAIVLWKSGRLSQASALAHDSAKALSSVGSEEYAAVSQLLLGLVQLHQGAFDGSMSTTVAIAGRTRVDDTSRLALLAREYLGDVHLEQGQAAEALQIYDSVLPKALALVPKGDIVAELRRRRAECYYLLGQHERAYEEALTGLKHCRELGDRYEEAATYRVLALASAAVGRTAEAKAWFDQGFAYYEDIETPYEWGKLWLAYGDWLHGPHAGRYADATAAAEAYRAAREHFERMGAEAKLKLAESRLAQIAPALQAGPAMVGGELANEIREKARAPRRPRASSEIERRAAWATETFGMVTRHRAVLDMLEQCAKLAAGRAPILVLGESGTGKELIAAGIHKISGRPGQYMPLNCASIPAEVFESELFGHMAGAFTGATRDKIGIVEACDGGTMFLDEVGEMPVELQARVLRFLESGEFRRVGATRNTRADTRLVAATNRDRASLKGGEGFRADLYYRLAHGVVTLIPLRQRGDDIVLLIEHFLDQACVEAGKRIVFADSAWARLGAHPWPGNVRELRSTLHRIVALAHDGAVIEADHIELDDSDVPTNLLEETIVVEKRRIEEALRQAGGMKSEAARILGLSRTTLLSKMKRYGMME